MRFNKQGSHVIFTFFHRFVTCLNPTVLFIRLTRKLVHNQDWCHGVKSHPVHSYKIPVRNYKIPVHSYEIESFALHPRVTYWFKVNSRNIGTKCEIRSKLTIKVSVRLHWRCSSVFTVNFEYIFFRCFHYWLWTS